MFTNKDKVTVYEPNYIFKLGIRIWGYMIRELISAKELIWRLMVRDISARYKQSALGILWAFLAPIVMLIVFIWIRKRNILPIGDTLMPYPAFVFLGQMIWLLFSQGVTNSANSLVTAGSLISKINFPREALVLSSLGQTIFDFLIRIPLLFVIFIWVGFNPKWSIVLVPLALIPLLFMIIGIGFIVSLLNAIIRDVSSMLTIIMSIGMFAAPVIYPPPTSWPIDFLVNYVNPVSGSITAVRDLVSVGYLTNVSSYLTSSLFGILLFLLGWRMFHIVEPKIAERI